MTLHYLHVFMHLLDYLALFFLCGLAVARAWLVPQQAFGMQEFCLRWRRMLGGCLLVLVFTSVAILFIRRAEMAGNSPGGIFAGLLAVLWQTHFGAVWAEHLVILMLLGGLWVAARKRFPATLWTPVMISGVLALTFTCSASSHPGGQGGYTLMELNDWLHLVASAAWGGGIMITVFLVLPALRRQYLLISQVLLRLSGFSAVALVLALASGFYGAVLRLPDLAALAASDYGHTLSVKLALAGFMMLTGALNRFVIIPCLVRYPSDADRFTRQAGLVLVMDALLVLLVLLSSSMLIQGMPPVRASTL